CDEPEPAEIEGTIELVASRGEDVALLRPEEELEVSFPLRRWNVETRDRQVVGHGQPGGGGPLGRAGEGREVLGTEACPGRGRDLRRLSQLVDELLGDPAAGEHNRGLVARGAPSARPELRDRRQDQTEAVSLFRRVDVQIEEVGVPRETI